MNQTALDVNWSFIYIYIYNRIEQCALPVTTIMALWQLVNLGTRCTVTHCRIALWSHQSAQTASSEQCINANSERLSERLSTQSIRYIICKLNLQTVLFRPLRSHQCSSEWFENWDMSISQRAINTSHTDKQ